MTVMALTRGKRLAVATAAVSLVVAAAGAVPLARAVVDWWYEIPVVRTWGDLLAQEPIEVEPGVKVRLGFEAKSCPAGSGVLLYCLAEGPLPPISGSIHDRLGPLHVWVRAKGALLWDNDSSLGIRGQPTSAPRNLFVRLVPVVRAEAFDVRVSTHQGAILRQAVVRGTATPFHGWSPLRPALQEVFPRHPPGEQPVTIAACEGGPSYEALPDWDGLIPYAPSEAKSGITDTSMPLPGLFPATPDPELKLEARSGGLLLTSEKPMEMWCWEDQFLARWWVNNEPLLPGNSAFSLERNGSRTRALERQLQLLLSWQFNAGRVRSGDRIMVQLLCCGQGWSFLGMESGLSPAWKSPSRSRLTNKVEFVVP